MHVKVKMNKSAIRTLSQAQITALEQTAKAVKTDVMAANVIPFDEGTLQNESTMIDTSRSKRGHAAISSDTPYARRLYFHPEYNFHKDKNPHAQGRWYDPWINGRKKDLAIKAFRAIYKRLTGV
ncbi:MAG TPA: hypothetical protein GXX75_23325 [Clostridiales bacterium]|nr:hypothetical protein [Clostridiales bacterium]